MTAVLTVLIRRNRWGWVVTDQSGKRKLVVDNFPSKHKAIAARTRYFNERKVG
jgi:hypothetical protein